MDDAFVVSVLTSIAISELGTAVEACTLIDGLCIALTPHRDRLRAVGLPTLLIEDLLHLSMFKNGLLGGTHGENGLGNVVIGDTDDAHRLVRSRELADNVCDTVLIGCEVGRGHLSHISESLVLLGKCLPCGVLRVED